MSRVITVRGVEIGAGLPKIAAPLMGFTHAEIINRAKDLAELGLGRQGSPIDVVEWRADHFANVCDRQCVVDVLTDLRSALPHTPLLFTFRSKQEGGEKEISPAYYSALNKAAAESGLADLIDVEIFSAAALARQNIENIHAANALVVASYHDFLATPPAAEIKARLQKMQDMGADILKIAVMPTCAADVLTLLSATEEMARSAKQPICAISMSKLGAISRLAAGIFGSALTFGAVGPPSAPGQIPVEQLAQTLAIIHNS